MKQRNFSFRALMLGALLVMIAAGCDTTLPATGTKPPTGPTGPTVATGDITFINDPNTSETVVVSKQIPGQKNTQFVVNLLPHTKQTIKAAKGDVFFFQVQEAPKLTIAPYTVVNFGASHQLTIGIRFIDDTHDYKRIANAGASRYSFDIFHINPLFISQSRQDGGGMQRQIFESLADDDTDWTAYDGDVALKNTFSLHLANRGEGMAQTEMYYGSQAFESGFSSNIGVTGDVEVAKASLSVGFDKTTKNESSHGEVFAFSRKADTAYIIDLVPQAAKLDRPFKEAVLSLPVPTTTPTSLAQAKSQAGYSKYVDFYKIWGTHYATHVHYGGYIAAYSRQTMEDFLQEDGWGVTVKAGVEVPVEAAKVGVEGSFSYSQKEKYANSSGSDKMGYFFVGGKGDNKQWDLSGDDVEPIKIQLSRLDELLTPLFFKDQTPAAELAGRQAMLKFALEEYIGSRKDNGSSLRPRVFQMVADGWKLNTGLNKDDHWDIYGVIVMGIQDGIGNSKGGLKVLLAVDQDGKESLDDAGNEIAPADRKTTDKYVSAREGQKNALSGKLTQIVYPVGGQFYLPAYSCILNARLFWKNRYIGGRNHCIGQEFKTLDFSKVGTNPNQLLSIHFTQNNACSPSNDYMLTDGTWSIDVNVKVYEVTSSKLGFDD